FAPARNAAQMEAAARDTFARLGDTPFTLTDLVWENQAAVFVPISKLNALRRVLMHELESKRAARRAAWISGLQAQAAGDRANLQTSRPHHEPFRWSIKVDRASYLDAFEDEDWSDLDEIVIDIARDHPAALREKLDALANLVGRERIRLALP